MLILYVFKLVFLFVLFLDKFKLYIKSSKLLKGNKPEKSYDILNCFPTIAIVCVYDSFI